MPDFNDGTCPVLIEIAHLRHQVLGMKQSNPWWGTSQLPIIGNHRD